MDMPGYTAGSANLAEQYGGNSMFRKSAADGFVGLDGQNIEANASAFSFVHKLVFRSIFNPMDYNGQFKREIKDAYTTNELGLFIFVGFFISLGWTFVF
jgi:hypothetical protein